MKKMLLGLLNLISIFCSASQDVVGSDNGSSGCCAVVASFAAHQLQILDAVSQTMDSPAGLASLAESSQAAFSDSVTVTSLAQQHESYLADYTERVMDSVAVHGTNFLTVSDENIVIKACGVRFDGSPAPRGMVHFSLNCVAEVIEERPTKFLIVFPFAALARNVHTFHPEDVTVAHDVIVPLRDSRIFFDQACTEIEAAKKLGYVCIKSENHKRNLESLLAGRRPRAVLNDLLKTKVVYPFSPIVRFLPSSGFWTCYPQPNGFSVPIGHPDAYSPFGFACDLVPVAFDPYQKKNLISSERRFVSLLRLEALKKVDHEIFITQLRQTFSVAGNSVNAFLDYFGNIQKLSLGLDDDALQMNGAGDADRASCLKLFEYIINLPFQRFSEVIQVFDRYNVPQKDILKLRVIHMRGLLKRIEERIGVGQQIRLADSELDTCVASHLSGVWPARTRVQLKEQVETIRASLKEVTRAIARFPRTQEENDNAVVAMLTGLQPRRSIFDLLGRFNDPNPSLSVPGVEAYIWDGSRYDSSQ